MKDWKISVVIGIIFFILTLAIVIQINTVEQVTESIGSPLRENRELRDEYVRWRGRYNTALAELQRREDQLSIIRDTALANSDVDDYRQLQFEENNALLGLTDITGNGVIIVIDDNRDIDTTEFSNVSGLLIHEDDILNIINELFNAGADAISVEGQRIISSTSIMCDGNIIRVNGQQIGVPIQIRAIGFTERLYYALNRPGGYLDIMRNDGIPVLMQKSDNVRIDRFEGVLRYEYIR